MERKKSLNMQKKKKINFICVIILEENLPTKMTSDMISVCFSWSQGEVKWSIGRINKKKEVKVKLSGQLDVSWRHLPARVFALLSGVTAVKWRNCWRVKWSNCLAESEVG